METIERISIDPAICNGKPCINGTRITVQSILEYLAAGDSEKEILDAFPQLTKEDIHSALSFASKLTAHTYIVKTVA